MFQFPASPTLGQIYSPTAGVSYKFDGTGWAPYDGLGAIVVQDTQPSQVQGEQWFESDTGALYLRYQNPDATFTYIQISPAAGADYILTSQKGVANGVASLGSDGKVPSSQIPAVSGGYVPNGGTTGQVLSKNSATDQDTGWATPAAGGGGGGTNLLINGKFAIDQRNCGTLFDAFQSDDINYGPDRWGEKRTSGGGSWITLQREADASYPGEFRLKVGVGGVESGPTATEQYTLEQRIEGRVAAPLNLGSANASSFTLAFEVESTMTGTFPVAFRNSAKDRSYVTTFTINAANTRETKTITVPGDTTGTWLKDSQAGLGVCFCHAGGSNFNAAAANTWAAGNFLNLATSTNFMTSTSNAMRFKNVRLYKGSSDLGPDTRMWAEEVALCQRYFWKTFPLEQKPAGGSTLSGEVGAAQWMAPVNGAVNHFVSCRSPVTMRMGAGTGIDPYVIATFYNTVNTNNEPRNITGTAGDFSATALVGRGEAAVSFQTTAHASVSAGNSCVAHLACSIDYGS